MFLVHSIVTPMQCNTMVMDDATNVDLLVESFIVL